MVGVESVGGHHPAGLKVGAVVLESVAEVGVGVRVPGGRQATLRRVEDAGAARGQRERGRVGTPVQVRSRLLLYCQRRRPGRLPTLGGRRARVQSGVAQL